MREDEANETPGKLWAALLGGSWDAKNNLLVG